MNHLAKFNIGDVVLHTQQGYRAVVVDIDPLFQASGRYNPQARQRSFAHQNPWYRLLVDETSQMTYVEEPLLQLDSQTPKKTIKNPLLKRYNHRKFH
ncbi:MAG: heat shock protein HspQ [Legionella sp.]|nr:heat shock protein HspQ [Legionella sp.]